MQIQTESANKACIKRIVLDVLKPHLPNALDFSQILAALGRDYRVHLTVIEVDEQTETLQVVVEGGAIDFEAVQASINDMGASIHSIDEVEVQSEASDT
jgi:hypothetical protein